MPVPDPVPTDDLGIDYSDIEAKYAISYEEGFDNVLVVDGVPVIDNAREGRLFTKISKEFARKGVPIKEGGMHMPYDEASGKSKGYIFVEFASPEEASDALAAMHHFPFDAKHTFSINRFTDIEKYATLDETYVPPTVSNYTPRPHMRSWLADPAGRDQFLTYVGEEVQIFWNARTGPDPAFARHNWTDLYVAWSPHGTYLATLHRQGLQIWGGSDWGLVRRIAHPLARLVDFSPNEKYLVTWSNEPIVIPPGAQQGPTFFSPDDEGNNLAVWEVATGHLLRTFSVEGTTTAATGEKKQMAWPQLKWSGDDRYVARVNPGQAISVYEVPGMHMLDKKSIKIDGVVDFEWCPLSDDELSKIREGEREGDKSALDGKKEKKTGAARVRENILAYWVPEVANQPARVTLLAIPSRTQLRTKNLFSVSECKLYWQNQGDFLCVKVDRPTKSKKATFCNLEVFRTREKDFPVEVIELKDQVTEFAWEPRGDRFAILSSSDPNLGNIGPGITIKMDVSLFQLEKGKNFKLLKLLKDKTTNAIRWSPKGRHVVLGSIFPVTKFELEFYDLEFTIDPERINTHTAEWGSLVQHLATVEHYGVTDVEWDPSGRYVASSASVWRPTPEHGWSLWDFRGQELVKQPADKFKQFLWRPRPRTLLTKAQQKEVRKNLKEYSRVFEEADAAEESHADKELVAQRRRLLDEWNAWRKKVRPEVQERMARLGRKAKGGEEREEVEEWLEEVIEEVVEVVNV